MWSECRTSFPSSGASVFIESLSGCFYVASLVQCDIVDYIQLRSGKYRLQGSDPCPIVWRAPSGSGLLIHFTFHFLLCVGQFESESLNVCPVLLLSGDCQKAHETCTSIRVPDSSFGGHRLYCMICFDGIPTLRVPLLTSSIMNFSLRFRLSFGLLSVPPPHPCGIRRIMSRQWVPCGDMLIFCSLFGQVELVGLGVGCLIKSRQVRVRTANTRVNPFMKAKNITEVKDESSFL